MNLQIDLARRSQPMKYRVWKEHRTVGIVVGIEWPEAFKVGFRDWISQNHPAGTRDNEGFGGVRRRLRNRIQQDDVVFLLG